MKIFTGIFKIKYKTFMKTSYLIPCLMAIAFITGCIKEEGEELTIIRRVGDSTMLSNEGGYFYGEAQKDKCIGNYDTIVISTSGVKKVQKVDCYMEIESKFYDLSPSYYNANAAKDTIIKCGFVYSRKNQKPIVGADDCYAEYVDNFKLDGNDTLKFSKELHNLDFNAKYFIRSFVINQKKDTCYNAQVLDTTTTLPGDVWFQRNDAKLGGGIKMPICFTIEDGDYKGVYIYGGCDGYECKYDLWKYNKDDDEWEQIASYSEGDNSEYFSRRCNGAAFVTKGLKENFDDYLVYICGGEDQDSKPTNKVFTYNPRTNRFNSQQDHPNGRSRVQDLPQPLTGLIAFELKNQGGGDHDKLYYVGLGSTATDITKPENKSINSLIYKYEVQYDRTYTTDEIDKSALSWSNNTSLTSNNNTIGEGLSNPVFIKVNETSFYIGTGNSSRSKNYINENSDTVKTNLSNTFYYFSANTTGTLTLNTNRTITAPAEFLPRTNAVGFFLSYNKGERSFNRLYVGTGKDDNGNILKDFWAYDLSDSKWIRCSDCSIEKYRCGAIGFVVERTDDEYYNAMGANKRGIVAFGEGYDANGATLFKDVWEYLP